MATLPKNFLLLNQEQTKQLSMVVEIEGVDLLTNRPIYTTLRYGDPEIFYGDIGLAFGGLRRVSGVRDIIDIDKASMVIAQRLEPEQGKGAIQQISLSFIDKDLYMSQILARGPIINEILGRPTRMWLGYQGSSYPDDYFVVFRGYITAVDSYPGYVNIQFSDANAKRREQAFYTPQVALAADIGPTDTNIPVVNTNDFYKHIVGPNGKYDVNGPWNTDGTYNPVALRQTGVRTFLLVDNEMIEYGPLGFFGQPTTTLEQVKFVNTNPSQTQVTAAYVAGASPGSEFVTTTGTQIFVHIASGTTTANQVIALVNASPGVLALNIVSSRAGGIFLAIQNVNFFFSDPQTHDVVISWIDGAPTPTHPIVTVSGVNVTVQIQSGVTTSLQIVSAIDQAVAVAALGVRASLVDPLLASSPQTAPAGPISVGGAPQTAPAGPSIVAFGFGGCLRGARGTTADSHQVDATVQPAILLTENAMILALKLMLSGWNGPCVSSVTLFSVVSTADPILNNQPGAIILPTSIDAVRDYGLSPGDYVTLSGSVVPGNNITSPVVRFGRLNGQDNRIIYLANKSLIPEYPTMATLVLAIKAAFRSQYDTYPVNAGNALVMADVDVAGHLEVRNDWLADAGDNYQFLITATIDNLKNFIEEQIYLPVSAYSLTRRGTLSVNITKPPLVQGHILLLNQDNVKDPHTIKISRATNNRKFFNEIDYLFDYDDQGNPKTSLVFLNEDSLSVVGISSILPISAQGVRTSLGSVPLLEDRAKSLLARYKYGAAIIDLVSNWEIGVQIEAGDVVALVDDGHLQISNFDTGERNLGSQLFEVVNRSLDTKSGDCKLQLISGIGLSLTDRYGVISPSSLVMSGTNSYLIIEDSFGAQFPGNEMEKWINFANQRIILHDEAWTVSYETKITGFDPVNNYKMTISGFSVLPGSFAGLVMDIPSYPMTTKKLDDSLYKAIFAYFSPIVPIVSVASRDQFDVSMSDVGFFFVGCFIRVEKPDYSVWTGNTTEFIVASITGTTINLTKPLPFLPDNTYIISGIGFTDKTGAYRFI